MNTKSYYGNKNGYQGPYHAYETFILSSMKRGSRLLDVGCGRYFPMANKWITSRAEIHGIDPVADTSMKIPGVNFHKGAAENLPFADDYFDFIVSCAVFEHIQKPREVLSEFNRVSKMGGQVVILTSSKFDYVSIIARIIPNIFHKQIVRLSQGRNEADTFSTYYKANSFKDLKRIARKEGFIIQKFYYLDQSPYAFRFSNVLSKAALFYHRLIDAVPQFSFLKGWILCVMEKTRSIKPK